MTYKKRYEYQKEIILKQREEINRQKAEIEEYEKVVGKLGRKDGKVVCVLKGKETEYIPTSIAKVHRKLAISKAKAEAIKDCTEKLKSIFGEWIYGNRTDDIFKEMGGDV